MPVDDNSMPYLLDLRLRLETHGGGERDVCVELRASPEEIDGPDGFILTIELKKVMLGLDLAGVEIVPQTRLGEPIREIQEVQKRTTSLKTAAAGHAKASAGLDLTSVVPAKLKLEADMSVEAKFASSTSSKQEISEYRIKARGGDTWEVAEISSKVPGAAFSVPSLDGTYLNGEMLCSVQEQSRANRVAVTLTAFVKQRDVKLTTRKGKLLQNFMSPNQEKLFNIFVKRSLGMSGGKYAGIVKLSRSEIEIEN